MCITPTSTESLKIFRKLRSNVCGRVIRIASYIEIQFNFEQLYCKEAIIRGRGGGGVNAEYPFDEALEHTIDIILKAPEWINIHYI